MIAQALERWHACISSKSMANLDQIIADDAVFYSPIVHTPQEGKALVMLYLNAAGEVLTQGNFVYLNEYTSEDGAVLEFQTEVDGLTINGVDMIRWNNEGKICEFKVMIRPLKAINHVHAAMGKKLQELAS